MTCTVKNCEAYVSPSLRQRFPAGDCVTFSGKDCLCQRCTRPKSPTPNNVRYPSSKFSFMELNVQEKDFLFLLKNIDS